MRNILFYDFETTGMPDFGAPSESEHQPHIVQAGAVLVDAESREIRASLDLIARPDGWVIPPESTEVHGITHERALACGIDERLVISALHGMWRAASSRVGYNESFDARIMRIGLKRSGWEDGEQIADAWKEAPAECAMRQATPICKIPSTRGGGFKWPKLSQAHEIIIGSTFENAHSAMADALACMRVYWAIKDRVTA